MRPTPSSVFSMQYRAGKRRQGAAVTELAITLPLVVLIVMGTIETCSMIFLRQALRIAAYEGARVTLVPDAEMQNVQAACDQILNARRVQGAVVTVTPADFGQRPYGTVVNVSVTASCEENSLFVPWIFSGQSLTSELSMMIER